MAVNLQNHDNESEILSPSIFALLLILNHLKVKLWPLELYLILEIKYWLNSFLKLKNLNIDWIEE